MLCDKISRLNLQWVEWHSVEWRFEERSCSPPLETCSTSLVPAMWRVFGVDMAVWVLWWAKHCRHSAWWDPKASWRDVYGEASAGNNGYKLWWRWWILRHILCWYLRQHVCQPAGIYNTLQSLTETCLTCWERLGNFPQSVKLILYILKIFVTEWCCELFSKTFPQIPYSSHSIPTLSHHINTITAP